MRSHYAYLLLGTSAFMLPEAAVAQLCVSLPSCESWGYTRSAADCTGAARVLHCPLDLTKLFCVPQEEVNCGIGLLFKDGQCVINPCAGYPVKDCDADFGTCDPEDFCQSGQQKKYRYTACNEGWDLKDGTCESSVCDGYPSTSCSSTAGSCVSCKTGTSYKYKYTSCNKGWHLSNNVCQTDYCSGTTSTYGCETIDNSYSCQSGTSIYKRCLSCRKGYYLSSGGCATNSCTGYPYMTSCDTSIGTCASETCQRGDTVYYRYQSCKEGWTLNSSSGDCNKSACEGYSYYSCPENSVCSTCKTGTSYRYKITSCNEGYILKDGCGYDRCCASNPCSGYDLYNCDAVKGTCGTCLSGTSLRYKYISCTADYYLQNGNCYKRF